MKDTSSNVLRSGGVIYFSTDNGRTWINRSDGLPDNVSLGLGAIAVSSTSLAIATKEHGVYFFDFDKRTWLEIPTDEKVREKSIGPLIFFNDRIFVGTQSGGVFTFDMEKNNWSGVNGGLANLTIRRFTEIDHKLYVCTNGGLYHLIETDKRWERDGADTLQVNGVAGLNENIFIATNIGGFRASKNTRKWKQVFQGHALHNVKSIGERIYAMVYNELLVSKDGGENWEAIQKGLPQGLYTFEVIWSAGSLFAGQWDGVYRWSDETWDWNHSSKGLPSKFAVVNMTIYNGTMVIGAGERKLNK
jgi:hypothetical protein